MIRRFTEVDPGIAAARVGVYSVFALGLVWFAPRQVSADAPDASAVPHDAPVQCNHQQAQSFLIRGNYVPRGDHAEHERRRAAHQRAIRYRTEHYGYFAPFGDPAWNAHPPGHYAASTTFFGLRVVMNREIIPALHCVEHEIRRTCAAHPYHPSSLAGIRHENTYHTGEVTNHAYGIAIDVDPDRNTCCHCIAAWARAPACLRPSRSIWDRMAMPECWVDAFERFGFYWLGHDTLQDTMHFEFLGDPSHIVRGG